MDKYILKHALEDYVRRGFSLLPLKAIPPESGEKKWKKKPLVNWKDRQRERLKEEDVLSEFYKFHNPLIGCVTGQISGICTLDIDDEEGRKMADELVPDSLLVPTFKTMNGGLQMVFQNPEPSIPGKVRFLPGLDYRGEGSLAILPPSHNGKDGQYSWLEGLTLQEVSPPALPSALLSALLNNNSFYKEGCGQEKTRETTKTTNGHKFYSQGSRDNDIFHAANCLIKGGCELPFVDETLDILARNSNPPFPESEVRIKIESALKHAESRQRNISEEVRGWASTTSGHFSTTDCHKELQLTTKEQMKAANMALLRLCDGLNHLLEKYGDKRGCYRRVENNIEPVNFLTAPTNEFPISLPMGIDNYCNLYPGNIVIVAGSKSAGKTSFLLNIVKDNMTQHEIIYLNSEMGDTEFRKRLELFEDVNLQDWKFKAYHRASNFADLITPEKKIFIVDFLEVTSDFWKVAQYIQEIHKKLKEGICIIALQKSAGKVLGRGGDFSMEKARLYLTLDYLEDQKVNRIQIAEAKAWRTNRNPRGMYRDYKLVNGSIYIPVNDWNE
jgi:hypothetical protein